MGKHANGHNFFLQAIINIFPNQNFYQCEEANCQTETRHQQIPNKNADKI